MAAAFRSLPSCANWRMCEFSASTIPVAILHRPDPIHEVSPSGNTGMTTLLTKDSHSVAVTRPPGLAVPK